MASFRLPREAQQIERIMESFANRYYSNNPTAFEHQDTAFVLSFSLIMLNTDAHNPNVTQKMTLDQFVANNKGINNGKDLPLELLTTLYENIVNNEIPIEHERSDISQWDKQGW